MTIAALWRNRNTHAKVWALTLPMILSNISVPLVGLVDTAVMGRLPEAHNMAAVGLGSGLYLFIVGILNFLRMGTTGFTAQAHGARQEGLLRQILLQGGLLALGLALLFILIALPFANEMLHLIAQLQDGGGATPFIAEARTFFYWRLGGLPAALLNFVLVGWFLGLQNGRIPLLIMITTNVANMVLSILFVLQFRWGVVGAAQAAIIAEWLGVFVGGIALLPYLRKLSGGLNFYRLTQWREWAPLLSVNRDIFLRSLALQVAFLLVTIRGSNLGEETLAANMIILNGLLLISYLLDGFAHAIESLCGRAIGAGDRQGLGAILVVAGGWGLIVSLLFALLFLFCGRSFIDLISTISAVRESAYPLIPYLLLLPLISVWSYLFDGLFIGATRAKEMRNGMILALLLALLVGGVTLSLGNHGLWIAFLTFMGARGFISALFAWQIEKREGWVS